ncbi:MAG: putative secreted protein, partial [Myxococcales bacterium]|nr:putative secreted protein [Myxococcales bacterium]
LRPVAPGTVLRLDTTYASYSDPTTHHDGSTVVSMLLASYKVTPNLSPLVRIGFVQNNAPSAGPMAAYPTVSGNATSNPLVGLIYGRKVEALRFAGFGAVTLPIGGGGGGPPDPTKPGVAGAESQAVLARSGMDNAMFAVNYFTAIVGGDAAYVAHKLTIQAEATLFQLFRARGDNNLKASNDSTRTNSTFGLHVGYFLLPMLSVGTELRYQRWLSTPTTGAKNAMTGVVASTNFADNKLDTMTVAVGPRFHFKVGKSIWIRPGLSYSRGLDRPLSDASYNMFQFDVPVIF